MIYVIFWIGVLFVYIMTVGAIFARRPSQRIGCPWQNEGPSGHDGPCEGPAGDFRCYPCRAISKDEPSDFAFALFFPVTIPGLFVCRLLAVLFSAGYRLGRGGR